MGYSSDLRRLELSGAVAAEIKSEAEATMEDWATTASMLRIPDVPLEFRRALPLSDDGDDCLGDPGVDGARALPSSSFNERHVASSSPPGDDDETLLQYVSTGEGRGGGLLASEVLARAARRCALIKSVFVIISEADRVHEGPGVSRLQRLAEATIANGSLDDMMDGGINERATWCVRTKRYDTTAATGAEAVRGRGMFGEMSPLLERLGGDVDLNRPDVQLYVLDGLRGRGTLLARKLADGVQASLLAPKTRSCTTATPLCPIAAFAMCNIAKIGNGSTVLDPFAGSCTTLLAASKAVAATSSAQRSSSSPHIPTVGIDVSLGDKGMREDRILADFENRGLTPPVALIRGDCRSRAVRDEARAAIRRRRGGGNQVGFDAIVTDPPYGMRESMTDCRRDGSGSDDPCGSSSYVPPLAELLSAMAADLRAGTPLLRHGGRLVAFVPVRRSSAEGDRMDITGDMPRSEQIAEAGLVLVAIRHQRLSSNLSRCLAVFETSFQEPNADT